MREIGQIEGTEGKREVKFFQVPVTKHAASRGQARIFQD